LIPFGASESHHQFALQHSRPSGVYGKYHKCYVKRTRYIIPCIMSAKLKSLIIVQDTYFLQALCHKKAHVNYSCRRRTFIKASPLYLFLNILLYSLPSALVYRTYNMSVCRLQSNPFWQPRNLFRNASRLQIILSLCFVLGKDCLFLCLSSLWLCIYSYLQWHLHITFDILGAEKYSFLQAP
jgi:hypothetical protein